MVFLGLHQHSVSIMILLLACLSLFFNLSHIFAIIDLYTSIRLHHLAPAPSDFSSTSKCKSIK